MNVLEMLTDGELIAVLQRRGYIVRHKSEARHPLSWNRTAPLPDGLNFEAEAVAKIRDQISPDILHFETREAIDDLIPKTHSAFLRFI